MAEGGCNTNNPIEDVDNQAKERTNFKGSPELRALLAGMLNASRKLDNTSAPINDDPTKCLRELKMDYEEKGENTAATQENNPDSHEIDNNSYFEEIVMSRNGTYGKKNMWLDVDISKMLKLQDADLVIVYRDNNWTSEIAKQVESLVNTKYGGKVCCISIDRSIDRLNDSELKIFGYILKEYPCLTDDTISERTGVKTKKFDKELPDDLQNFLEDIKTIEKNCIRNGVDTVYIYSSGLVEDRKKSQETGKDERMWHDFLLEHGCYLQEKDGTIHFQRKGEINWEYIEEIRDKAKRFWRNAFPNLNVEFVENGEHFDDWSKYKTENSVLILDGHRPGFFHKYKQYAFGGDMIKIRGVDFELNDKYLQQKASNIETGRGRNSKIIERILARYHGKEAEFKQNETKTRASKIAERLFSEKF